jgi:hypothetical protein
MTKLEELAALCRASGLRYRWQTRRTADGWEAEVQAGQADANWMPTGAFPRWGGSGDTEEEAITIAAGHALWYWSRPTGH